jgi:hypothetical protein
MGECLYSKMRTKERFNVELNAVFSIKGEGTQHQECRITNLSSSGAQVRFPRTGSLSSGAVVSLNITIPNTIMRIATEAEIMWIRQRFNELIGGIKFTGILSDSMIQQLAKKNP